MVKSWAAYVVIWAASGRRGSCYSPKNTELGVLALFLCLETLCAGRERERLRGMTPSGSCWWLQLNGNTTFICWNVCGHAHTHACICVHASANVRRMTVGGMTFGSQLLHPPCVFQGSDTSVESTCSHWAVQPALSFLIVLSHPFHTTLNKSWDCEHTCLIPDSGGNAFRFPFSKNLTVGLFILPSIVLRYVLSISSSFRVFNHEVILNFLKGYFCSYWYFFKCVYVLYYTYWFVYTEPNLHHWYETIEIIVYSLSIFLTILGRNLIENFHYLYSSGKWSKSVFLIWCWYWSNTGFIERVWWCLPFLYHGTVWRALLFSLLLW